jgi:hypothetical protein
MPHALRTLVAAAAVGGLALSGVMTAGAASAAARGPGTRGPGSRSVDPGAGSNAISLAGLAGGRGGAARDHAFGRITAAPTSTRTFAGYQTSVTAGSATSSAATFTVPAVSCTTASVGISADAGVAANNFKSDSVAGVFTGCAKGKAVYFPWLLVNGTEANYTSTPLSAGDVINLSVSVTTSGITVQVTDTTKGVSVTNTITGAGAGANAAWIGDDAWFSSTGTLLGVPNFGKLKFFNCLIDGTALQSLNPQEYQRVNHVGVVQIATGPFSPAPAAFATYYKHI